MANSNDLPIELWALIGELLNTYVDYVRFRSVCSSWRNILPKWPILFANVPCLMLPYFHPIYQNFRSFYNPLNHEIFYFNLSNFKYQFCSGSSNGWLIILENDHNLKLLNPFTNSQFLLPPISSFSNILDYAPAQNQFPIVRPLFENFTMSQIIVHVLHLNKIVLSPCPPHSNDFIAIAIHGKFSRLSFTKLGKNGWTEIPTSRSSDFHDCVISNGKIYAINSRAELWVSNIETPKEMVNLGLKRLKLKKWSKLYLVKTDNDELLMIERRLNIELLLNHWDYLDRDYETIGFNLFKLDSSNERLRWIKVNNLDNSCAIFLGLNTSIYHRGLLNGNCIYYSDDQTKRHVYDYLGGHDFGVFDIANNSCRRLLDDHHLIRNFVWPPPVWVALKDSNIDVS